MKEELLQIKFDGLRLKTQAMPIYELGETFIAIQQAVHKGWLIETGSEQRELLRRDVRRDLALEIRSHSKSSDLYSLASVLADPRAITLATSAISLVLKGFASYAAKKVLKKIIGKDGKSRSVLVEESPGAIVLINSTYNQVTQVQRPIGGIGGCERLVLTSPFETKCGPIVFDQETKTYTAALAREIAYGPSRTIVGRPYRLYVSSKTLTLSGKRKINVRFEDDKLFDRVRYAKSGVQQFQFEGRYVFQLGDESRRSDNFEARDVKPIALGDD